MIEKIKPVNNPLTIIAIFAALAEIATTVALVGVSQPIQEIFVWFVMAFPTLIVLLFFATLNWNSAVLYAPSDFKNEENYMHTIGRVARKIDDALQFVNEETEKLDPAKTSIVEPSPTPGHATPNEGGAEESQSEAEFNRRVAGLQETLDNLKVLLNDAKQSVQSDEPTMSLANLSKVQNDILRVLRKRKSLLIPEIAGLAGISPAIASQMVNVLHNGGFVIRDGEKVRLHPSFRASTVLLP